MEATEKVAAVIGAKGPLAIRWVKTCVDRGVQMDIESGSAIEAEAFGACFASGETGEGMTAFLEKRKPQFDKVGNK